MTSHVLVDGKLRLYQRKDNPYWHCSTNLGNKKWRVSTKEADFARAKDIAEDWYWTLRENFAAGLIKPLRRFRDVAAAFYDEYTTLTVGQRSPQYVEGHANRIRLYLNPFFGTMPIEAVTTGTIRSFRVWRCELAMAKHGKQVAPNDVIPLPENVLETFQRIIQPVRRTEINLLIF